MNQLDTEAAAAKSDKQRLIQEYGRRKQDEASQHKYSAFNSGNLFFSHSRQRNLIALLKQTGIQEISGKTILEVGSGSGGVLHELLGLGADANRIFGVELLPWRCQEAYRKLPDPKITQADGCFLPFSDRLFDLVMQFTMFTSVLDDKVKQALASEMLRVVKPEGAIVWYDFWLNPTNPQTKGIRMGEMRRLFPGCSIISRKITLAPPVARRLIAFSWIFCELIEKIKIFNTHFLATIRPSHKYSMS